MSNVSQGSLALWVKALVAALVLATGASYLLAFSHAPEAQARNGGCMHGQQLMIPSGMAVAHFVDIRAVGCGPVPNMAASWVHVFQGGRR